MPTTMPTSVRKAVRPPVFIPRRIVRDYMFAGQVLMKTPDLTEAEIEAVIEMAEQLTKKFVPVDELQS